MMTAIVSALVLAQYAPTGMMVQRAATPRPRLGDAEVLGAIGARDANLIEAATLGGGKASSNDVKTYANNVLQAHQRSLTRGADLAKELNLSRTLPADSAMARKQEQSMNDLSLLSGAAFDRAFVQYLADAYAAEIEKVSSSQLPGAQHASVKAFVSSRLPELQAHHATATRWLAANPP
jgi:putative membrane protein